MDNPMFDEPTELERMMAKYRQDNMTGAGQGGGFDPTGGASPGFGPSLAYDPADNAGVEARAKQRLARSSGGMGAGAESQHYGDLGLATQAPSELELSIARLMGRNGGF